MMKSMPGPYTNIKFMPTGGIIAKNMNEYLGFSKVIACGGSWMVNADLIAQKVFDKITDRTKEAVMTMLGFELKHIGINCEDAVQADNVAVSLANYGFDAKFVTKLPKHEIGQAAVNSLRKYGVVTSFIARSGERVGIYFLEKGASQRLSKVIYDRAESSIATAAAGDFNWKEIFEGAEWFHFTGITPALNDAVAAICLEA